VREFCSGKSRQYSIRDLSRARQSGRFEQVLGDRSEGDPPVPIPNTEVKPFSPDCTARASVWESRKLPGLYQEPQPKGWGSCCFDSSEEIMGGFRLRQLAKRVIKGQFEYPVGAKAVGFFLRVTFALLFKPSTAPLEISFCARK
jgi:hypothetical protein